MTDKTDREIMRQSLEVLVQHVKHYDYEQFTSVCELEPAKDLILVLCERLAQPEQEPVADEEKLIDLLEAARETFKKSPSGSECSQNAAYVHSVLETMLIKREWQGLTDEEISAISKSIPGGTEVNLAKRLFAREIEDKLKEKNT